MHRSPRLLALLLLPLLAAGASGIRWAHHAIAHGQAAAGGAEACGLGHAACGHASRSTACEKEGVPGDASRDRCLDCDLLGEMVAGAAPEPEIAVAIAVSVERRRAAASVEVPPARGVHRARPPPIA